MSHTQASGSIGSIHLRYTAHALDECLEHAINAKCVDATVLPKRLLEAAKDFLRTALSARAGQGSQDPSTSIANYRIAASALRGSNRAQHGAQPDLSEPLRQHLELLESLSRQRRLRVHELKALAELRSFFGALFHAAEARSYSAAMDEQLDEETPRLSTRG